MISSSGGWQTVNNADGQSYLKNRWSDNGPDNYTAFHSDAFQEVMDRLDAAFDYDERVQCFVDAEQILDRRESDSVPVCKRKRNADQYRYRGKRNRIPD